MSEGGWNNEFVFWNVDQWTRYFVILGENSGDARKTRGILNIEINKKIREDSQGEDRAGLPAADRERETGEECGPKTGQYSVWSPDKLYS
jgi:hypothetical protein